MIDTPQITQTAAQLTAMIHLTIPRGEVRNVMGPGINEVTAAVAAQGIAPAGPWFTHHLRMDPDTFDFEICVPVTAPVAAVGRVKPGQLPATTVARTVYRGHYEGLGAAWAEFDAWIKAQGHTPAPDLWECYAVGPEANADPASWRTELNRPLIAKFSTEQLRRGERGLADFTIGGITMPETAHFSPEVTEYIQKITQGWQVDICNRLRTAIHQAIPDVKERIVMTTPNYARNGKTLCVFFAAKSWVNLSIFNTKDLAIPEGLFDATDNPDRMQVKIKQGRGFDDQALLTFLQQVAAAV